MQGLEQIIAQNARAAEAAGIRDRDPTKYALVKYDGLHFISVEAFDTEAEREKAVIKWQQPYPTGRGPNARVERIDPVVAPVTVN